MFPVFLLVGLLPWNFCGEAVGSGTRSVLDNANLIKKVFFPREVLPLVSVFSSLLNFVLSLPMMFLLMAVVQLLYPPLGGRLNFSWTFAYSACCWSSRRSSWLGWCCPPARWRCSSAILCI